MNDYHDTSMIKRLGSIVLLSLAVAMFAWPYVASKVRPDSSGRLISTSGISAKSSRPRTKPIETLKVGDRVLAHNPEVSATERANWTEPNWQEWLQLSLTMPKADGSILNIEILRPESWVREQLGLLVQPVTMDPPSIAPERGPEPEASAIAPIVLNDAQLAYSPLRPIFRDLALTGVELEISGEELQAIFVEMDLPELAITGPADVREIQNAPPIKAGDGRVVTATFCHSSGDVIDLVVGDNSSSSQSPIGTTSNHPFWSVDREEYVQAGQLEIGERLQTHSGDTKRVVSKLARPGPQPVYNLEVFAEHVYYVGEDGVLVHNSQSYGGDKLNQKYLYRVIRNDENPLSGLIAKNPSRGMSIEGHIISGSRNLGSQFISTTTSFKEALKWARRDNLRIVRIDLSELSLSNTVTNLSTPSLAARHLKGITSQRFAVSSKEVLIEGIINSRALTLMRDYRMGQKVIPRAFE